MNTNSETQSANEKEDQGPDAKWTVMIYFAADNDLEEEAIADLKEMKKVGSNHEVKIVAQLDSRGRGKTFRFLIGDEQTTLDEDVVEQLDEINTGDPRELTKFICWGANYKAKNYMLVLWGHGRGWEDLDNADRAAAPTTDAVIFNKDLAEHAGHGEEGQPDDCDSVAITRRKEIRTFLKNGTDRQKAGRTLESHISRNDIGKAAITIRLQSSKGSAPQDNGAYEIHSSDQTSSKRTESESSIGLMTDQTPGIESEISQDVLKMDELKLALDEAYKSTGREINILGMDACLMGMAEVGYQIKDHVKYLVASEDAIPDEGWPYEQILSRLIKDSDMSDKDLAVTIIREFLLYYRKQNRDVTKSSCNLAMSGVLTEDLKKLALQLIDKIPTDHGPLVAAILASRAMTQSFYLKDYVDLYDFCSHLRLLSGDKDIKDSCSKLMEIIGGMKQNAGNAQSAPQTSSTDKQFVHSYGFIGHRLRDSNGVSIYFPCYIPSSKYAELPFAEESKWGEFLAALSGLFSEQSSFSEVATDTVGIPPVVVGGRVKASQGTEQKIDQGIQQKLPAPLPRRAHKSPATSHEKTVADKSAAKGKKVVSKK